MHTSQARYASYRREDAGLALLLFPPFALLTVPRPGLVSLIVFSGVADTWAPVDVSGAVWIWFAMEGDPQLQRVL